MMDNKRKVLLIGSTNDLAAAKTAINILRYDHRQVVALLVTGSCVATTANEMLGVGGDTPIVTSIAAVGEADQLVLGTVPPGGRIEAAWRDIIRGAVQRGWDVISGMHQFISDDAEFVRLAAEHGANLVDVRKTEFREVASRKGIREDCLRIHTVGHDSNVGKMVVSLEAARALQSAGHDAQFVATGQTGIMIAGDGLPMDAVVADFLNGAAEELVRRNQHHDILLVEGQGSIVNPMFSGVTMGLLHGCMPDGLILCYQTNRTHFRHTDIPIPPLDVLARLYENIASINHPCSVIAVGMNSRSMSAEDAAAEKDRVQQKLGLPVVDVIRDGGAGGLVQPILSLKKRIGK